VVSGRSRPRRPGAIDWLLRHGKEGLTPRPLDWGKTAELAKIDEEMQQRALPGIGASTVGSLGAPLGQGPLLAAAALTPERTRWHDPDGMRGWYVNGQGQTMVLAPDPPPFLMGSPKDEPDRWDSETLHRVRIGRSFAVASKPVTVAQWRQFLKDRPKAPQNWNTNSSPQPDCPINGMSWYMAAQYCNWLSEQEGIPRDQWCYPDDKEIRNGMKPFPDYLKRTGYRLATEAEWEYACRYGAESSRYYGSSEELLPRYAWYLDNSRDRVRKTRSRTWPVGQKRPNDLGLFDMHGNLFTWLQDVSDAYPDETLNIDKEDLSPIEDDQSRVLRGGSFDDRPVYVRSAFRHYLRPESRNLNFVGLRVARTYH
jgi:formylglycine-generating enzyme required for sulfatase activity